MTDPTPPQQQPQPGYGQQSPLVPPAAPPYVVPSYPTSPYQNAPMQPAPGAPPVMPYTYGYAPAPVTNGLAVASLILSILGFLWVLPLVGSIAGVIMGHISLRQIAERGQGGRGMALTGTIIGWIGIGLTVLAIVFFVIVIAVAASTSSSSI